MPSARDVASAGAPGSQDLLPRQQGQGHVPLPRRAGDAPSATTTIHTTPLAANLRLSSSYQCHMFRAGRQQPLLLALIQPLVDAHVMEAVATPQRCPHPYRSTDTLCRNGGGSWQEGLPFVIDYMQERVVELQQSEFCSLVHHGFLYINACGTCDSQHHHRLMKLPMLTTTVVVLMYGQPSRPCQPSRTSRSAASWRHTGQHQRKVRQQRLSTCSPGAAMLIKIRHRAVDST